MIFVIFKCDFFKKRRRGRKFLFKEVIYIIVEFEVEIKMEEVLGG